MVKTIKFFINNNYIIIIIFYVRKKIENIITLAKNSKFISMDQKHKLRKILLIIIGVILIISVVIILFISPITKYLIEKNDEKYTGRNITMDWAYVNPFTGYVHLNNLKINEFKSDSVFFSAKGISINFSLFKLFSKTYEISQLTLDQPRGFIIQNKNDFNFNDILKMFTTDNVLDTTKAPVHFNILSIKINDGEFYYHEPLIPINYFIKNVNLESTGKRWDSDSISTYISFVPGIGSGKVKGNITINLKNNDYHFNVVIQKFDLNIIEQYLKDLTNYGNFSANLDADVKSKGNFNDPEDVTTTGFIQINDFHFGKNNLNDYASFDKLSLTMNNISPKDHIYLFDSVILSHPYFKYERYDYLDNIQTMFGVDGANLTSAKSNTAKFNLVIEIADYVKILGRNFFQSYYQINRLAINKGDIKFNDYSLGEKFSIDLNPLSVVADSVDKNHDRANVYFKTGIKPYGDAVVNLSINPKDTGDFDMVYNLKKFPASMFNPYIISYTSFPLDRGTIEVNGTWKVRNGIIKSENHLVVIDPRVTKKIRNKDTKWVPLPLIMSFIRERGNVIDYEIPITGNMKNPKFHLHDVIFDLLENIFVKPATTSYRLQVKNNETEIEKSLTLKWSLRNSVLLSSQVKFVEKIADFLKKNPDASIVIYPQIYSLKEKEYILLFEAKKRYYIASHNLDARLFNEEDSEVVDKMSIKDTLFVQYLNKQVKDSMVFTVQEKCSRIIDESIVNEHFRKLSKDREEAFKLYFTKKDVVKRVDFNDAENVIPYNGFSFYNIKYKGELPGSLLDAYKKMNELNDEAPRDKFKNYRKRNKSTL